MQRDTYHYFGFVTFLHRQIQYVKETWKTGVKFKKNYHEKSMFLQRKTHKTREPEIPLNLAFH